MRLVTLSLGVFVVLKGVFKLQKQLVWVFF